MASVRPDVPGHDHSAAFVRLRRGKLADSPSGQRRQENTAEGPYEVICPRCGDDPDRDWSEISEELRRIRGAYATKQGAEAALMDHIGMQTRLLGAPGDVAYGADGDAAGTVAQLAGEVCPDLLLGVRGEG